MPLNMENFRAYQKKYYQEHREEKVLKSKIKDLANLYGISKEQYDFMIENQGGKCAICKSSWTKKGPTVDHDHATGKVRGILCSNCNWALGLIHDDRNVAWGMIDYLCDSQQIKEV